MENSKSLEISKEAARRFLILKQSFLEKKEGKDGTLAAIKKIECVQTDPINVVHRNQHLVLHNRVADYQLAYLEELLYKDRLVFEYWCNEKSIIPVDDFPYFRYRMQNPTRFHSPFYERIKAQRKEMKDTIAYILSEIKKHGTLSAREFGQKGMVKSKIATKVLNLLWDCGDLMIHHVEANVRYYDLTEHLLSPEIIAEVPTKEEFKQFIVRKYMRAYGLIDTRDWRFGWLPLKVTERKAIVKEMVEENKLCPVKIADVKHVYYVLKEYLPLLEDSDTQINEKVHFIAPLDNLLWNRKMVFEVFDFNYSWEVYKVPENRIYGYYVMPILYGTRFIGRLDPKLDRQNKTMVINSLILEKESFDTCLLNESAVAMQRFIEFHGAHQIRIEKTQPKELKDALLSKLSQDLIL